MTDTAEPTLSTSPEIDQVAAALVEALPELGNLAKDREGKIQLNAGGSYSFKYADLKQLLDLSKPVLASHGLVVMQPAANAPGGARVHTLILHKSGQWIRDEGLFIPAAKNTDPKAYGSAVSYARRYSLASMLSIAQADDDAYAAGQPEKPKARNANEPKVKLATKKVRDDLQARIQALPSHYSGQIGARLREAGVAWTKLDVDKAAEVAVWVEDCEGLAANEGPA
jgi:hypothetical protein